MEHINKVKSISIWVFIVPFVAVNACLILTTQFHHLDLIPSQYKISYPFPYLDGGVSISRTARYFPTYLIFKPAMFFTSYLLIVYWLNNRRIINSFESDNKYNIETELEDYVKRGGKLFIEYAEQLIKKPNFNFKIIQLESIRFFLKKSPKKDYSMIAKHIEELFL